MMMMMMISNYSFDELYFADFLMFLKIHLHLQIQDLRDVYDKHPVPFPSVMLLPQSTAASPDPPSPSPAASPPLAASDALPAFGGVLPSYVAAPGFLQLPLIDGVFDPRHTKRLPLAGSHITDFMLKLRLRKIIFGSV
eukprot:gb/GECH01010983.1/.p1 GENE.gb/GECH01010983.1/~~gb/GECH01010983.1/.p1  ORF type:complete len:138 (+),score=28.91 gb/GECH01010983.1/:1-414(+)